MEKKFTEEEFQQFVVEQFGKMGGRLDDVDARFGTMDERFASVQVVQESIVTRLGALRTDVHDGFRDVHEEIQTIKATLEPLSTAFDRDAETVVEHDRRITRVDKHLGFTQA